MNRNFNFFLLVLGLIGVIDSAFLLILLGTAGFNFGTVFPGIVGIILSFYSTIRLIKKGEYFIIKNTILRRMFKVVLSIFLISFILIEGFIMLSARSQNNVKVSYVVILGAGLRGNLITYTLKYRLDKGIEYLNKNPETKVVVTGGQGLGETITEAEAMKSYLLKNGISEDRIIEENKATSTLENFKYTSELLKHQQNQEKIKIMIITSDFHMFRSKILAKRNGFIPYGITSNTYKYILPNCYIREYFAVIKSLLFDK